MPSGKPREKHYCWRPVSLLAEPTALAWHSRAQKPLLAKSEPPHPGLPTPLLSLGLSQPQLGLANAGCQMGVGTRILWLSGPVHPSNMLVDHGLTQLPAWCLVQCKVVPSGETGWGWGLGGGNRAGRKAAAAAGCTPSLGQEKWCGCFRWTDEETEAQRGDVSCPWSQSGPSALLCLLLGH